VETILAVALGGALGSVARYLVMLAVNARLGAQFPYAILGINVAGSFAAGLLSALLIEKLGVGNAWRGLVLVGFLGGFTTFSAFSVETMRLLETGALAAALANIVASVVLCLLACAAGLWLGR
jgi:CrcB protein